MSAVLIVGPILLALFVLGGRCIQLHPERVVPKGQFVGPNSPGARLFRVQVLLVGSVMVFGGTAGVFYGVLLAGQQATSQPFLLV